jgi:hypothetical protein
MKSLQLAGCASLFFLILSMGANADPDPVSVLQIINGSFPNCLVKNAIPPAIFVRNSSSNKFVSAKINIHQVMNGSGSGTDTEVDKSIGPGQSAFITCKGAFWPPNTVSDTVQIISATFQ